MPENKTPPSSFVLACAQLLITLVVFGIFWLLAPLSWALMALAGGLVSVCADYMTYLGVEVADRLKLSEGTGVVLSLALRWGLLLSVLVYIAANGAAFKLYPDVVVFLLSLTLVRLLAVVLLAFVWPLDKHKS
ncbi:MAG: hypothetical protein ACR2PW_04010 [Gammaproteobacteria bacterium]